MSVEIVMPRAGLTMVEGTINSWKAAEGAQVKKGDVLMEYENEKSMIEYEALDAGILHILAQEGDTVAVGAPIGVLAADRAEYEAIVGGAAPTTAATAETPAAAPVSAGTTEGVVEIAMPRAGLTMVEGTIISWKVAEGALVAKDDVVMEYENEKSTIAYEIVHGGYIHILAKEDETVAVGAPIAWVAETEAQYKAALNGGAAPAAVKPAEPAAVADAASKSDQTAAPSAAPRASGRIRATGLAKKMAAEAGIALADVTPSGGPDGQRVVAKDVDAYLKKPKTAAPASAAEEEEIEQIPWTGVRKAIARNMFNSLQQTAQNTSVCEVDATELLALRAKLVEDQAYLGCKITVNDLLCKMLGKVMVKHPFLNATFDGSTLSVHKHVDLAVAVGAEDGLMVPVVRRVDTLSLAEINARVKDLAQRAKEKKLKPQEQTGGSLTITNVGMYPIDIGTPILNLPQVAILGFGRTVLKPAVLADGTIGPRSMMHVFITFDHRVADGLIVGRALGDIQYYIEHPEMILA